MINELLEDSRVRLTTLVVVVVCVLGSITGLTVFIFHETKWRTNIQRDILETRNAVNEVKLIVEKGTGDRFTYSQMQTWVQRFKELNEKSTIKIPKLPERNK